MVVKTIEGKLVLMRRFSIQQCLKFNIDCSLHSFLQIFFNLKKNTKNKTVYQKNNDINNETLNLRMSLCFQLPRRHVIY